MSDTGRDFARHTDLVDLRKTVETESRETRKVLQGLRDDLAQDRLVEQERRALEQHRFDLLERKVDSLDTARKREIDAAHDANRRTADRLTGLEVKLGTGGDCGSKRPSVWLANPLTLAWFYPGRALVVTIIVCALLIQESRAYLLSLLPPLRWGVSL